MFKLRYLFTVFLVVSCVQCGFYYPEDGDGLVQLLCGLKNDSTVTLNSTIPYDITLNASCLVYGSFNVLITSSEETAYISCVGDTLSTFGIGFVNTSVAIQGVFFEGCGAYLRLFASNSLLNEFVASTNKHFLPNHSAIFVFIGGNITFTDIHFHRCYGFAAIAINVLGGHFENVFLNDSRNTPNDENPGGTGVLVVYTKSHHKTATNILFENCLFRGGEALVQSQSLYMCDLFGILPNIHGVGGLTLLSFGVTRNVSLIISNVTFNHNIGGGLLIELHNTNTTTVLIKGSCFESNYNLYCPGPALAFYMSSDISFPLLIEPLTVVNTNFHDNRGTTGFDANSEHQFKQGSAHIGINGSFSNLTLNFTNVTFTQNMAANTASCLMVEVLRFFPAGVKVVLEAIFAEKNQQATHNGRLSAGLFTFVNIRRVEVANGCKFYENMGSIIRGYESQIYLSEQIIFASNVGYKGAALNVQNGHIYFAAGSNVTFRNNSAQYVGGVIYIHNEDFMHSLLCALQLPQEDLFNVTFYNNSAIKGGNLIYAYPAYRCVMSSWPGTNINSSDFYRDLLNFFDNGNLTNRPLLPFISAVDEIHVNMCKTSTKSTYPGETVQHSVSVKDGSGNHVYAEIHLTTEKINSTHQEYTTTKAYIEPGQEHQVIEEKKNFSLIDITVRGYNEGNNDSHEITLFLSTSTNAIPATCPLYITIGCPLGFSVNGYGVCDCSRSVQSKFYVANQYKWGELCSINNRTLVYPKAPMISLWIGNAGKDDLKLSLHCPLDLCTSPFRYKAFYVAKADSSNPEFCLTDDMYPSGLVSLCQHNRTGVMCGECADGLSVVFGTSECKECSNWWLWTIILYIVAGPLLVYIMYVLRLSLKAGTLNGIIFFAQIANVGILDLMMYYQQFVKHLGKFSLVFVSLLNLNLGFPMCFFNGMDELWKTGLSLVFPVYLVLIALIMITVSHFNGKRFSNRLSYSSVQILITVVHLSLSKLLITTIDVFTPVELYLEYRDTNDTQNVWFRNGNESFGFGNGKLISLMVVTTLVTGLFLVPYVITLFGGKLFIKAPFRAKYFKLAYESIHAPYREKRRYWFASRFLLQISLYLVYAVFRTTSNISLTYFISLPLLMAFLIIQVYLRPYKSKGLNILDLVVMLITVIMYIVSWYMLLHYEVEDKMDICTTLLVTLIFIIFVLFLCVVGYHFVVVTTIYQRITALWRIRRAKDDPEAKEPFLPSSGEVDDSFYRSSDKPSPVAGYL